MKKTMISLLLVMAGWMLAEAQVYEYKVITTIESIVPMGLGRSRIIANNEDVNYKDFTTTRVNGKESNQSNIDRSDVKIENMDETKLLNFYSGVGINFQNIASNDAVITSKLNTMAQEGWELAYVVSGVESKGSKDDSEGIFITRFVFKKKK